MQYGEVTTGELAKLFNATGKTIALLATKGIIVPAGKRGRWRQDASISRYIRHLREQAAGRGGEEGQGDARRDAAHSCRRARR